MDVVIRPVNDRFLREVVFPAFQLGVMDAVPALERLLEEITDDRASLLIEMLLTKGVEGSFFTLDAETWLEAAYRLLFWEWIPSRRGGWAVSSEYLGFAGPLDETLNLALMMEDGRYPYWDASASRQIRESFFDAPDPSRELSALMCGLWDECPDFPPDQALSTHGRETRYDPVAGVAIADWTWRTSLAVSQAAARLPAKLASLLKREGDRLRPIAIPEHEEIYDFWMGRASHPPILSVAFSGLGQGAFNWVRDIGALARVIRSASELEQGLTVVLAPAGKRQSYDDY